MQVSGKIKKINTELGYGFITVAKVGDVFFSSKTVYAGITFESLKVDDQVQVLVIETERGAFAQSLSPKVARRTNHLPEATV